MRLYGGYIFDLDGTIYLGDELIPGAAETLAALKDAGAGVRFLTNNPTKSPAEYAEKLTRLGVPCTPEEVFNTVKSSAQWLTANAQGQKVFAIGEPLLTQWLRDAGVELTDQVDEIDIVLASYDRTLEYSKLRIAFQALHRKNPARLMATNPDFYCPLPGNTGEPDAGATVALLEASTGVTLERHFGKPNTTLLDEAIKDAGLDPSNTIFVGDRLHTDIAMAVRAGIDSALVLTGDSQRADLEKLASDDHPTYVLESVVNLLPRERRGCLPH